MVIEIDGGGQYYKDVAQDLGIVGSHRTLFFPTGGRYNLGNILKGLSQYPEYNGSSYLLHDVVNLGDSLKTLFVPRECPSIYDSEPQDAEEKPAEGEAWYAKAIYGNDRHPWEMLILSNSPEDAYRIAKALSRGNSREGIQVRSLSPGEYMFEAERMLHAGYHLTPSLRRFGKLERIFREVQACRANYNANLDPQ